MVPEIGHVAGAVWRHLKENGDTSVPKLVKELNENDFVVYAALGWLAREDKVDVFVKGRTKMAKLK